MNAKAPNASEFDFIVIGAGSSGAVVAARLSEGNATVLLLEAGPTDRSPWIHLPIGFSKTFRNAAINWMYESDPEPHLGQRRIYWPKGKVLGGSSAINGLIWLRGLPSDYDTWQQLGSTGWGSQEVMPIFDRVERVGGEASLTENSLGPLRLSLPNWRTELSEAFIAAAANWTGTRREDAFNVGEQLGGGYFLHTQHEGRRTSSATAYLRPARHRSNLRVITQALACEIQFDGDQARRVCFTCKGQVRTVRARREIILSAGAINSPQLLQLSGVGPPNILERAGVRVRHALPGVGANFHDHFTSRVTLGTDSVRTTLNSVAGTWYGKVNVALEWMMKKSGPLTIGAGVAGAYVKANAQALEPDVQFILVPFKTDKLYKRLSPDAGFQILVTPSRPSSRGRVAIRTANPKQAPSMFANYLDTQADQNAAVEGLQKALELVSLSELRPFVNQQLAPGLSVRGASQLLQYARETGSSTQHQAGSCKMGTDRMAVVDPRLRVHGIAGLRVADASVMPQVISANTNAACFMIGERCADFVKQDHSDCFDPAK